MTQNTFIIVVDEVDDGSNTTDSEVTVTNFNFLSKEQKKCDACNYGYWLPEFGQRPPARLLKKFLVYYYEKVFNDLHNNNVTRECFEFYSKDCSECFKHIKTRKGIIVPIEPTNGHRLSCKMPNGCFACKQIPYSPSSKKYNKRHEFCFACVTVPYVYKEKEKEKEKEIDLDFYAYKTEGCELCENLFQQRKGDIVNIMPYPEKFD
jgi:hypothetical protein